MTSRSRNPRLEGAGILGAVLAGGESRRFGGEKALFPLLGRPMAEWALAALTPWTSTQVVIAPTHGMESALGVGVRPDVKPGFGPLGGLFTALGWAQEEGFGGVFLLACDLPLMSETLVGAILSRWPKSSLAVVPGSYGPLGFEPLCAGFEVGALPVVEALLASGRRAMEDALVDLHAYRIPPETLGGRDELGRAFLNVNTQEMASRAEKILRDQGRAFPGALPTSSASPEIDSPEGAGPAPGRYGGEKG